MGSDNITLSQATDANGGTVSFIGGAGGAFGRQSTMGNVYRMPRAAQPRADITLSGPPTVVHVISVSAPTLLPLGDRGDAITERIHDLLRSSWPRPRCQRPGWSPISTNGSTISIGVPGTLDGDWQNMPAGTGGLQTHIASISKTPFYWHEAIPRITANSLAFRVSFVTANTLASLSAHLGIYTFVNSTSMALLGSLSEAYVISSASSASFSGIRNLVMTGIGTHTALSTLGPGNYGFGMMFSAGASQSMNASLMGASTASGPLGMIFPGTNSASTATSQGVQGLWGRGSTTVNAMPANVVRSELVNQGSGASAQLHPWIYIRSSMSIFDAAPMNLISDFTGSDQSPLSEGGNWARSIAQGTRYS